MQSVAFSKLPKLLSWHESRDVSSGLEMRYINRISEAYRVETARLAAKGYLNSNVFADNLRNLADEAFLRILLAPETCTALTALATRRPEDASQFLVETVQIEHALWNDSLFGTVGRWTALGDYFVASCPPDNLSSLFRQTGKHAFRGPQVGEEIPIDLGCPINPSYPNANFQKAMLLDPDELSLTIAKLENALSQIKAVSDAAERLVRGFTKGLVLRKDGVRTRQFWNCSSNGAIGRSVLVNPHIESADIAELAEAVVHEAIHGMLYIVEMDEPFITNLAAVSNVRIRSPWTGAILNLPAYLHGCLVWFGLRQFWGHALRACVFGECRAQQRFVFTDAGFRKGPLDRTLADVKVHLRPEIVRVIQHAQEIVLDHAD